MVEQVCAAAAEADSTVVLTQERAFVFYVVQLQAGKGTSIVVDNPPEGEGKKKSACCSS